MLNLSHLKPRQKKKIRKRVGRGTGSGHGAYSGRGVKGQKARSGGSLRPGFEGGRMPLIRQIPKVRGFKSIYPKAQVVDLKDIVEIFPEGSVITVKALREKGLVNDARLPVKVLGKSPMGKKLVFKAVRLSAQARTMVEKGGGKIIEG